MSVEVAPKLNGLPVMAATEGAPVVSPAKIAAAKILEVAQEPEVKSSSFKDGAQAAEQKPAGGKGKKNKSKKAKGLLPGKVEEEGADTSEADEDAVKTAEAAPTPGVQEPGAKSPLGEETAKKMEEPKLATNGAEEPKLASEGVEKPKPASPAVVASAVSATPLVEPKPANGDKATTPAQAPKKAPDSKEPADPVPAVNHTAEPSPPVAVPVKAASASPVATKAVTPAAAAPPPLVAQPAAPASDAAPASPAADEKPEHDSGASISHAAPSPLPSTPIGQSQPSATNGEAPTTGKVQELMRMLSPQPSSIARSSSTDRVPKASEEPATLPSSKTPQVAPSVTPSRRTTGSIPMVISSHDKQNTVNAFQLLKLGAFKLQPLSDFVEYSELIKLRLEDGIDPTRREDYLNEEEFTKVFGMDRGAFKSMPSWKKVQKKKQVNLF